ncbi:carboxynorspermidine decarboxylase [Seleniivibrio woodruffii]|uniref:Carboxynorspermidine/carboxyspermidine decarboxylase n=1 Tax=Seleniivibrio woodruffii TaxID=1078050 RepID=A0A4R1KBY3_9BACT|nr:carboxynorspermidine decarboxylase [Seleniivibrio woodruffii]TCK62022.1 carboxynorspermidine decarboxylase [Seleniivibrio woodruffii]TVZ34861.1 carboxynorspermidine decarboxylase [Seleniivibrio woodruffii]
MSQQTKKILADFPQEITDKVDTPCYLISEDVIRRNCEMLNYVQLRTGAKILLAMKAFALPKVFPLISQYLHGVCASGPIEAQMGREEFGREVHTYSPAFSQWQMERTISFSDHIVFNSIGQWHTHRGAIAKSGRNIEVGLRVNPGHAEVEVDLYNPCLPGSRFGVNPNDLEGVDLTGISGLHFHAMCEQNSDVLTRVLASFEKRYGHLIPQMKWINFGGGHHITREDYDVELLCETIIDFRKRYNNIQVYLEPGEAVVLNAGVFVTKVLDKIHNGMDIAVVDSSAETHLPDVLAMPYRPVLVGAAEAGKYEFDCKIGCISCLAGDFIGTYSFRKKPQIGDRLVFTDMALYSFVKNTNFNGVELPDLAVFSLEKGSFEVVRRFGYEDYKSRLS